LTVDRKKKEELTACPPIAVVGLTEGKGKSEEEEGIKNFLIVFILA